ncbi:MAG: hypothetical protein A2Z72_04955 [Omnitrophica bacterium RBG_13_46_9]|nr:MAG: hypothetical protein A2Z72_04955 [Omnitrophica bacterium RBG_13_46_9]
MATRDRTIYNEPWFVYIARCRDKTLYTGIAKDAKKRITEHNTSISCRYTRGRKPVELLYEEKRLNYNKARKREAEIKRLSRKEKLELIDNK